jgi:hypothetical protein
MWPTNELLTACSSTPAFLLGEVRQEVEIGAAFYNLGILLKELVDDDHPWIEKLRVQARCLLTPDELRLLKTASV